jgi:hypothetical protein
MRPGYLSGYRELGLMIMLFGAKLFGKSIRCLKIHESPIQVIEISTRASYNFEKLRLYTLILSFFYSVQYLLIEERMNEEFANILAEVGSIPQNHLL